VRGNLSPFFKEVIRINPYKKLYIVAKAFLKRKAPISELRAAVRECEEKAAPATVCDGRHD
jgi:hypothetical protein